MKEQQLREQVLKLYRLLACAMVDHGELLETDVTVTGDGVQIKARAEKEDHGRLLGKGGATFRAFRTVFGLIGYRHGIAVRVLPLQDPIHGERAIFQPPMTPAENWKSDEIKGWLNQVLKEVLKFPFELDANEDDAEHKTIFVVTIDTREQMPLATSEFLKSLSIIFAAIGNNKGRHMTVATERPQAQETSSAIASAHSRLGTVQDTARSRRK